MVSTVSAVSPFCSSIGSTKSQIGQLHKSLLRHVQNHGVCSAKLPRMEQFHVPTKLTVALNYTQNKLWEFVPSPVKHFPWKKAESIALQEVLVLGKETLKWIVIAYFALSFVSDFSLSVSRSKELVIPFGLFVGCLMANYFDEISQEFMHGYKDVNITWRLLGIASFFVLMKIVSAYFAVGKYFLLHTANGGLMQLLWKLNKFQKQAGDGDLLEDASNPTHTGD